MRRRDRMEFVAGALLALGASIAAWAAILSFVAKVIAAELPSPSIHYAPHENLERIDVRLLDGAQTSIDMAAYVLTDVPVIRALVRAGERGVAVRIYRDASELNVGGVTVARELAALAATPGVILKVKGARTLMHLKSYVVDGRVLRAGAANFTASGLKQQDNDLSVIVDAAQVVEFRARFEEMWGR